MAAPAITSLTATPTNPAPGQQVTITGTAIDSDGRTVTFTWTATDASGISVSADVSVNVAESLTYNCTASDPNVTVTADPSVPGKFYATV